MKVVLIALLYVSTISEPSVLSMSYTYPDIQSCLQDAVDVEAWLMTTAPSSSAYIDIHCLVIPEEV